MPDDWTMDDLLGKHNSKPHNPRIAHVFYLAGFIESWGRGVEKIFRSCRSNGMDEPVYTIHPRDLLIRFDAPKELIIHKSGRQDVPINLSETDKKILLLAANNPSITLQSMAEELGVNRKTISRHMQVLEEQGLIQRIGSRKKGTWQVTTNA